MVDDEYNDDPDSPCYFCGEECAAADRCSGCNQYICADCKDRDDLPEKHDVEDHR